MRKLIPVVLLVVSFRLIAQTPYLVKDINSTVSFSAAGSAPYGFTPFGNLILFGAIVPATGEEPYVSDGNSGASLLADINPSTSYSRPTGFTALNGVDVFAANDGTHGIELWATDGTTAGTHLVMDIRPGAASSSPTPIGVVNNKLLFTADDGVHGIELWVTDGTTAGTTLLRDMTPGTPASSFSAGVTFKNAVYFGAFDGNVGLWKSDGTVAGTVKVANTGAAYFTVIGSQLFFMGYTPENGTELWVTDGTTAGTHIVLDINPGPADAFHSQYDAKNLIAVGNRLFFAADDGIHGREMWVSDGTAAGTHLIRDFIPGSKGMWDDNDAYITALGGRAFFTATDADHGSELWVTDGTDAGTNLFYDVLPGTVGSAPRELAVAGSNLFFLANQGLWVTDGSAAGTHRLGNVNSGPTITFVDHLIAIGNKIYFSAYSPLFGVEPWVSDGTEAGTHMFANIAPDGPPSSGPAPIFGSDTLLFFKASTGDPATGFIQTALWRSDGTSSGTFSLGNVGDPPPPSVAPQPTVFFLNSDTSLNSQTLYASDGTPQGTRVATDIVQHFPNATANVRRLFLFGDRLYANLYDGTSDIPLWATTTAPNAPAVSLGIRDADSMIDVAGRQIVKTTGNGLWSTDGTVAGTYAISPSAAPMSNLAEASGAVFFLQRASGENTKLWKTDGTYDGTVVVKTLTGVDSQTQEIKGAGRRVYFTSGGSLWTSDGTDAGTISLATLTPFIASQDLLYPAGTSIVFVQPGTSGFDIWGSDGTQAGTKRLATVSTVYPFLTPIEDRVYFNGYDASHGVEPWVTDGTPEGTRMLGDVNPGTASSSPAGFTKAANAVFFSAYDATFGDELWAFPLTDERLSIDDTRVAEGGTTAHFTVKLAPAANKSITVDYATSDGTAHAGSGYDNATGTLTFAPGETSKTIDVRVHGDSAGGTHTFFVTLRNPGAGARIVRADAAGFIDDGKQPADLSLTHDISSNGTGRVTILNHGPNAATIVTLTDTSAPAGFDCCIDATYPLITSGGTATRSFTSLPFAQFYGSATATGQQRDPNPADNSISWTDNQTRTMSMTPAFLTTGATGRVSVVTANASAGLTSSDPSVVSVPSTVGSVTNGVASFNVTALKAGTATVSVGSTSLLVTVVAPGTQPRWPGAIRVCCGNSNNFDRPAEVDVIPAATAPFSGAMATGAFTVSAGGQVLAHSTLNGKTVVLYVYLPALGLNTVQVAYEGDANFLPTNASMTVNVGKGQVTLNASLEPVPGTNGSYRLKVDANGSPVSPPTGTLTVMNGSTQIASVTFAATSGGTSNAQALLPNLSGSSTLTVQYSGDAFYLPTSQQVRALQPHRRAVHH